MSNKLSLSLAAANKIAELIAEENKPNLNLRVYITGGGCSGFQYGFAFDEIIQEDDTIIEELCANNIIVRVLIDPLSHPYLQAATIDFQSGLEEKFIIDNPKAKTTCGCGSSFSVDEEDITSD